MQKLVAGSHIPPPFYPWHFEANVSEEVIRRDIKFLITQQSALSQEDSIWLDSPRLYMIHNATLSAITRQELFLQQNRTVPYNNREKNFEDMVQHALDLANYLLNGNHDLGESVRAAMEQLVHPETVIPLFLSRGDWRLCSTFSFTYTNQDYKMYNLPIFTWAMPSTTTLCTPLALPSYEMWRRLKEESFQKPETPFDPTTAFPWKQKRSKVIWRGSTTGVTLDSMGNISSDWRELPRAKMIQIAKNNSDLLAFGITRPSSNWMDYSFEIEKGLGPFVPKIPLTEFAKYKAILDIDGNSWSSRLGSLLCFNSVVLRVDRDLINYFEHEELQPWVHYVPIKRDFSDLVKQARYVLDSRNEVQMKAIVKNANQWCRSKMSMGQFAIDTLWMLLTYVRLIEPVMNDWKNLPSSQEWMPVTPDQERYFLPR